MGMDVIEESGPSSRGQSDESSDEREVKSLKPPNNIRATRPTPLEVLKHVKMNNTLETPRSTIKGFLKYPMQTELKFSRENLKKVEEKLKLAFVEFYQKLRLLRSYRCLLINLY